MVSESDRQDFETLRKSLLLQLAPRSALQDIGFEQIVTCCWRCKLAIRLEMHRLKLHFTANNEYCAASPRALLANFSQRGVESGFRGRPVGGWTKVPGLDDHGCVTRESLAIAVGQRLKGEDVVATLNDIRLQRGVPKFLFCDNGSEFTSQIMHLWAYHNQVRIDFSRPGKPTDNAHVESFNGTLRAERLDVHWFATLTEAKQVIEGWRREYNDSRPHRSLGRRTPSEFAWQIALKNDLPGSQTVGNSP